MVPVNNSLLLLHIFAGVIALVAGFGALITKKGGSIHRRLGRGYIYAMGGVAGTGVLLSMVRWSPFLLIVAVFSFYLAFSGYRVLSRQRDGGKLLFRDMAVAGTVGLSAAIAALLVLFGWDGWIIEGSGMPRLLPVAFGAGCVWFVVADAWDSRDPIIESSQTIVPHLTRMFGSYIATIATVSITNFTFLPYSIRLSWPFLIGGPFLIFWRYRYQINEYSIPT